MMSSDNTPPLVQPSDHNRTKTPPSARKTTPQKLPEPAPLKCPRCDSSNTKFCYYNNYNLTQPRHFCKTCRRYWTKGGALRNVPIGGGCRKTRKHKPPSTSSSSPFSCPNPSSGLDLLAGTGGEAEFKFLAPPTMTPAVEFQLGGLSLPRLHPATAGVYTQFIANSGAQPPIGVMGSGTGRCFGLDLLGPSSNNNNYPPTFPTLGNNSSSPSSLLSLASGGGVGAGGGCGGGDQPLTISSIESLSSINQEMHWKLQQQRLAMIYGQPSFEDDNNNNDNQEKPLGGINLFKSLESARNDNKLQLTANLTPTDWLCEQIPANYGDNNNNNNINTNTNNNDHNNNNNNSSNMSVSSTTTSCNNHQGFWTTDLQQHQQQFNGLH